MKHVTLADFNAVLRKFLSLLPIGRECWEWSDHRNPAGYGVVRLCTGDGKRPQIVVPFSAFGTARSGGSQYMIRGTRDALRTELTELARSLGVAE